MLSAFKNRDYTLLFAGQSISHLGDQFNLIALPWLVLTLTHDPLQLGAVLAVVGIPRALLMLVGGAFADRCSPRLIMLASDVLRFVSTAALAVAVLTGTVQLWMVYALALAFGIVSGFFMPAAQSAVPRILPTDQLERGNAAIMGANQLASFLGPVAAGLLIAAFGAGSAVGAAKTASLTGIGIALAVDALSFLVSAVCLVSMRRIPAANSESDNHPLAEVAEGLRYAFGKPHLRFMFVAIACANFFIMGPMLVGLPVIANSRLAEGAAAFGIIMAASGIGSLVGMLGAGSLRRPGDRVFPWLAAALFVGFSISVASLAFVTQTWVVALLMFATGMGDGYIAVIAITALQRMTETPFLGRVMSLITLAMVGLAPVSQLLSGAIIRVSPTALFCGAGVGFLLTAAWILTKRNVWTFGDGEVGGTTAHAGAEWEAAAPTFMETADI